MPKTFAAADIGSNTAHLLVAEVNSQGVRRIENLSEWLALGEIVAKEKIIPVAVQESLVKSLRQFKNRAIELGATSFYAFGTEAIRASENKHEVLSAIKKGTGLDIKLISGREEADLGISGISLDCDVSGESLYFEIGGGSLQIAFCAGMRIIQEYSLPLGTGKLKSACCLDSHSDPKQLHSLNKIIEEALKSIPKFGTAKAFASGGVARGMVRSLHPEGEQTIQLFEVSYLSDSLASFDSKTLSLRFPIGSKRVSSMAYGVPVFKALLNHFGLARIRVSNFGVREGAIIKMYSGDLEGSKLKK